MKMNCRFLKFRLLVAVYLVLCPAAAWAQSAIAGSVTDGTGSVLPGVTVEATSPALIEKVRTVVTDGSGLYTVSDLRPGVYRVRFQLPGFNTVFREGVDLPSSFTATVNAVLTVGGLEESVTVSGQAPTVDVHRVERTAVLAREVIDMLPVGRGYRSVGVMLPGVNASGSSNRPQVGEVSSPPTLGTQGGDNWDTTTQIEGILTMTFHGNNNPPYNDAMILESTYTTTALPAEVSRGGVRVNLIGRDGGNTWLGGATFSASNGPWQAKNLTEDLVKRGLREPNRLYHAYDINPWFSGPIKRDRLWFFYSSRYQEPQELVASTAQGGGFGPRGGHITNHTSRLTWQVNPKHKISFHQDYIGRFNPVASLGDPGGTGWPKSMYYGPIVLKWSATMTNRLLFETGYSWNKMGTVKRYWNYKGNGTYNEGPPRGTPEWYAAAARMDIGTGITTVASQRGVGVFVPIVNHVSTSMSYVTGSHSVKTGLQATWGTQLDTAMWNADLFQIYQNGVPQFVDIVNSPTESLNKLNIDLGIYVQDSWTYRRLTVSPGVRFEHYNASIEARTLPAGRFMPARSFPRVPNLPNYNNTSPRFGVAYDLFGDGRTAVKASVSKYMAGAGLSESGGSRHYDPTVPVGSPAPGSAPLDRRSWTDRDLSGLNLPTNGDDIAQENEIGPSNNLNYGLRTPRRRDSSVTRPYAIEYAASVQHEILPGLSVALFLQRRPYNGLLASRNEAVSPADYASFQVANQLNAAEMITVYNLSRAKQGQVDLLDTTSEINQKIYNGIHMQVNARLPRGGLVTGSWSFERTVQITCDTNDPNQRRFCDQRGKLYQELGATGNMPFLSNVKLLAAVPGLPYGFTGSVAFRSYGGDPKVANWNVPAILFPGGRTASVTVPLIAPGTEFLPRWAQFDLGVKRTFRVGRTTLIADLTIFNVLNSNTVITETSTFGPSLYTPTSIIAGRLPRVGLQMRF